MLLLHVKRGISSQYRKYPLQKQIGGIYMQAWRWNIFHISFNPP